MSLAGTAAITELWAKCKAWFATKATASTTSTTASIQLKNNADTALGSAATIPAATTSAAGVMTADDKTKLNGIATGATAVTVDSAMSSSSTNPVQNKIINSALSGKAPTSHASSATTYGIGTSSNYGHVKLTDELGALEDLPTADDGVAPSAALLGAYVEQTTSAVAEITDSIEETYVAIQDYVDGLGFSPHEVGVFPNAKRYVVCSTAASTAVKEVTLSTNAAVSEGLIVLVKFANTNTAAVANLQLKVKHPNNTTGTAANIKYRGANLPSAGTLAAGRIYVFVYDGTNFELVGDLDTDTKNTAGSTDSSSKLFLVGATSQATNPQTYSQDTAYIGTDGHLYSDSKQVVNLSGTQALTNKTYNGYTLGAACAKAVDSSISSGSSSTNLPTSAAVASFVAGQITGASAFQDVVDSNTDISGSSYKKGWYWVVGTAGTYVGQTCEVGDMVFAVADKGASYSADDFTVVQNNVVEMTAAEVDAICV